MKQDGYTVRKPYKQGAIATDKYWEIVLATFLEGKSEEEKRIVLEGLNKDLKLKLEDYPAWLEKNNFSEKVDPNTGVIYIVKSVPI